MNASGRTVTIGSPAKRNLRVKPRPLGVKAQILQKLLDIDFRRALAGIAPRKGEIGLQHALHFLDVLLQIPRLVGLPHQGQRKLEPHEDGAQIVAYAVQHGGALLERAFDAPLHLDEGIARLAHFARAARREVEIAALAKSFCRPGEQENWLDLIAEEGDRHHDQNKGGADHPQNENMGIRGIGGAALGDHPQNRVIRAQF